MSTFKSDFLNVLSSRGFVHQISEPDVLDQLAQRPGLTAYIGFDCTASSLHVGSLIQIMMLYWLQQTGGRPIALMGGGTTRVGDPSGKDESRRLLTDDDIARNLDGIRAVFAKFLRFGSGPGDAAMANNADWLNTLNYIDFLRDVGRHFSVNRMLTFDSVKMRLDRQQELSFLEFNYMILQAYDFVELYKRERCVVQMGGSDQWGNIVSGIDLGRRMANAQLFALTTPLLTTSSGAKMGKTAAGAVWLNADMVSPYDYWQYWRNTEDADVARFLKLFTVLPLGEIERLGALHGAEINEAKKVLATEATALVHGREAADAAAATARQTFEEGTLAASLPTVEISQQELEQGLGVLIAFADKAQLVGSKNEARRQIKSGGLKVNDVTVADEKAVLTTNDLTPEGVVKLSLGRKRHVLLKPADVGSAVVRGEGNNKSEQYLAKLADRTFLNLWSYPNPFVKNEKGEGKELCDLLVVCGDDIIIFSVKEIGWQVDADEQLAWKRWYKRAILSSVDQIRGAERSISQSPDKLFVDRHCTQQLPLHLPPLERRRVHGIAVALGAGDACKRHFGEGIGSLFIVPEIKGDAHWKSGRVLPFTVGDVDPDGPFVHVFDDATLDIVMKELDTISDFTSYLAKKEALIRSERLVTAAGEEELVAYYLTHVNSRGEHDFTQPDGSDFKENQRFSLATGFHSNLLSNPQYLAKKAADKQSYIWDSLTEKFTTAMLAGTIVTPDRGPFIIADNEEGVRQMALVPRLLRRVLGGAILDVLQKGSAVHRFTRAYRPAPNERDGDTAYFFMTLAVGELDDDQYRMSRANTLQTFALALLRMHPELRQAVGVATEPRSTDATHGSSEDLIVVRQIEWSPALVEELEKRKKMYEIIQDGNYSQYEAQADEFPEVKQPKEDKGDDKSGSRR